MLQLLGSHAQTKSGQSIIAGFVKDITGTPIPGVSIRMKGQKNGTSTSVDGHFRLQHNKTGNVVIEFTAIGFEAAARTIKLNSAGKFSPNSNDTGKSTITHSTVVPDIIMNRKTEELQSVAIIGRTATQQVNRQAFNVTAVDATKLYNTTLDISGALDRVAGVRVRETGGVGSSFNVSLNGFSGRHIRYFIDGIPMDNFGSSFQINNIPINVAERVEVYKGVVPMWLGSDALGGAVNIVTGDKHKNYVDASYSYGSFNTHRTVLNLAATSKKGLTVQLNAFQNYSDNNYKTNLRLLLQNNMEANKRAPWVKRFHDTYHNETMIVHAGLVNKPFADNLLLGVTLGQNYKEMQTAARPETVYGQFHRRGNIIMPAFKYKKADVIKGLDVTVNANYNLGYEETIDTAYAKYDWDGIRDPKAIMGESNGGQHAKYRNNNGLATAMASYKLNDHHSIAVNNVFSTFNRKTDDILFPEKNDQEPAKKMDKNVLGFGYGYDVENKWSLNFFGKYIYLNNIIESKGVNRSQDKLGYGMALAYYIKPDLKIRTSYELTNRMPEANEVFGDLENLEPNPSLRPEKSDNFNIGIVYKFKINDFNRFSLTTNATYRYSADFIYNKFVGGTSGSQNKLIADNRQGVRTTGVDGEIRYSYKNWLSIGSTVTYQMLRNLQKYDLDANGNYYTNESFVYLDQMPNIPYLFGNTDISASFKNVFKEGNNLTLAYSLMYVNSFWLYWPSLGASSSEYKNGIPSQFTHDVNVVYTMKNGCYNLSLEEKNITDQQVFDNFALQKPGRGFYLNFRYFINNFNKSSQ